MHKHNGPRAQKQGWPGWYLLVFTEIPDREMYVPSAPAKIEEPESKLLWDAENAYSQEANVICRECIRPTGFGQCDICNEDIE
ncbi:MAG: hypothetical protein OHK0039_41270 [Bacteroidia bacterium]